MTTLEQRHDTTSRLLTKATHDILASLLKILRDLSIRLAPMHRARIPLQLVLAHLKNREIPTSLWLSAGWLLLLLLVTLTAK